MYIDKTTCNCCVNKEICSFYSVFIADVVKKLKKAIIMRLLNLKTVTITMEVFYWNIGDTISLMSIFNSSQ
jgi:hypothetical protein